MPVKRMTEGPAAAVEAAWTVCSPRGTPGGIAVFQISGDVAGALGVLGLALPGVGRVKLIEHVHAGEVLLARWGEGCLHLMPHGGAAAVRRCAQWLHASGLREAAPGWDREFWPEAHDDIEAAMLWTLSRAASPLAVDLLLAQPRRWREAGAHEKKPDPEREAALARLIDPPLVVALGGANIGKSTLANALAGRGVSIVADEAGTTRDHVGVMLEVDGLVVRYMDTPGLRDAPDATERESVSLSFTAAMGADLVLRCGDHASPPPVLPRELAAKPSIAVGLRGDLGPPCFHANAAVSLKDESHRRAGAAQIAREIRRTLVPDSVLLNPAPWRFWPRRSAPHPG